MECACAILSSVVCPVLQYFSTLSHKWHDFRKEVTEHEMCSDFLYKFCLKYLILRNVRDKIKKYIGLHVMSSLRSSDLHENLNFRDRFSQNTQI